MTTRLVFIKHWKAYSNDYAHFEPLGRTIYVIRCIVVDGDKHDKKGTFQVLKKRFAILVKHAVFRTCESR